LAPTLRQEDKETKGETPRTFFEESARQSEYWREETNRGLKPGSVGEVPFPGNKIIVMISTTIGRKKEKKMEKIRKEKVTPPENHGPQIKQFGIAQSKEVNGGDRKIIPTRAGRMGPKPRLVAIWGTRRLERDPWEGNSPSFPGGVRAGQAGGNLRKRRGGRVKRHTRQGDSGGGHDLGRHGEPGRPWGPFFGAEEKGNFRLRRVSLTTVSLVS